MAQAPNPLSAINMNIAGDAKEASAAAASIEGTPVFLVLSRKGLVDTELRNPHTDEVVYRITDTCRGSLSSKPDYEIYRNAGAEIFVGSIRFGKTSTEITMPLTGNKAKGVEKVKLHHVAGGTGDFLWNTIKAKRKVVKDRWLETNDNGISEIFTKEEVIVLELVDTAVGGGHNQTSQPLCVVRLINTQPTGRFEIWAKDAWVEEGGDWNAMDELVVSAYANMERAKRDLMKGLDSASWRGAAF